MFEETNTASGHHMDVDLELGDPPGDEKKGERFFFAEGTPCSRYMHSSFIPRKLSKAKS